MIYSMQSWSQSQAYSLVPRSQAWAEVTWYMNVRIALGIAPHLQFGQLDKPRADVMTIWSMSQQKAIKPRTQDSQRKLL